MKIVDANVLIYAVNSSAPHHAAARNWVERAVSGNALVGVPWLCSVAFVRVTTSRRLLPSPLTMAEALDYLQQWHGSSSVVAVGPGPRHLEFFHALLTQSGTSGNVVNDAHLAAIALETKGEIVSFDRDFTRFPSVRCELPS